MNQCDIQSTNYFRQKSAKKTYALDSNNEDFDKSSASTIADEHEKNSDMRISQSLGDFFHMDENENQIEDDIVDDDRDDHDNDDDTDEIENDDDDDDDNDDSTQLSINHPHSTKRKKSNKKKGKLEQLIK